MLKEYKVLIPTAGLGTRLEQFSKNLNKAMISVNNKPVISHVIEKFPQNIEIIIALGHKGELIKDYLNLTNIKKYNKLYQRKKKRSKHVKCRG